MFFAGNYTNQVVLKGEVPHSSNSEGDVAKKGYVETYRFLCVCIGRHSIVLRLMCFQLEI